MVRLGLTELVACLMGKQQRIDIVMRNDKGESPDGRRLPDVPDVRACSNNLLRGTRGSIADLRAFQEICSHHSYALAVRATASHPIHRLGPGPHRMEFSNITIESQCLFYYAQVLGS